MIGDLPPRRLNQAPGFFIRGGKRNRRNHHEIVLYLPVIALEAVYMEQEERTYGMLCHLSALSLYFAIPFGNILGPYLIWRWKRDRSPLIDAQGKDVLNYQLSFTLYLLGVLAATRLIGNCTHGMSNVIMIPLIGALVVGNLILLIRATTTAYNGSRYAYPFAICFIT
jgi:uncharacterized Tic20 family protein